MVLITTYKIVIVKKKKKKEGSKRPCRFNLLPKDEGSGPALAKSIVLIGRLRKSGGQKINIISLLLNKFS